MNVRRLTPYSGLLLALLATACVQGWLIARSATIGADGITFIYLARELPEHPIETFRRHDQHPGFPALVLATTRLAMACGAEDSPELWVHCAQAVTFVCGLLSVWVMWLFARELFGRHVADLAALVFAVVPIPRWDAAGGQSDTPHLLFYLLAAWLACSALTDQRWWRLVGAGLASAIAYWIRPEGLEVALVALACLALVALRQQWSWRQWMTSSAALAGTAALVAAPYPLLAGKITSKQLPFAKEKAPQTFIAQLASQPAAPSAAASPATTAASRPPADSVAPAPLEAPQISPPAEPVAVEAAAPLADPVAAPVAKPRYSFGLLASLLRQGLEKFVVSFCQGLKFVFVPFYLLGHLELYARRPQWSRIGFIALLGLSHIGILLAVFVLSGYIAHRHVLPVVSLAVPFAALGLVWAGTQVAKLVHVGSWVGIAGLWGLATAMILPYSLAPFNREFLPVIEATHWVEGQAAPGAGIISNSPYPGYYGKLPTAVAPAGAAKFSDAVLNAPPARYDYIVMHVNAHGYRPEWLAELEANYREVRMFPDPYSAARPKKVLVFESRRLSVTRAASEQRAQ